MWRATAQKKGVKGNAKRGKTQPVLYVLLAFLSVLFLMSSTGYMIPLGTASPPKRDSRGGYGRMLREEWGASAAPVAEWSFDEKWRLLDSVLGLEVFEMNVTRLPPLLPLFREYEKAREWFVPGLQMTDYDRSCDGYYEDSLSNAGDFDKKQYEDIEYWYKEVQRNRTGEIPTGTILCGAKSHDVDYGCCVPGNQWVPHACLCSFDDGPKDALAFVQEKKILNLNMNIARAFTLSHSDLGKTMRNLYGKMLQTFGYAEEPGSKAYELMVKMKNFSYMPPGGFIMWHTNRYDNNQASYRMYMYAVDVDGGSSFKYLSPEGELVEVPDFHGAVRLFSNTHVDAETGKQSYLWHTVATPHAHRLSVGFEILPEHMVALIDSCDGCWADLERQYSALGSGKRYSGVVDHQWE